MRSTNDSQTTISPPPPAQPRLRMRQDLAGRGLPDGGWRPRTADPAADLPGLIPVGLLTAISASSEHSPVITATAARPESSS